MPEPFGDLSDIAPCSNKSEAHVCRSVWKPIQGTPACFAAGMSASRRSLPSR